MGKRGRGFRGKRPFGNSGWEFYVYKPLIEGGFIEGKLDEDGFVEKLDTKMAHKFVLEEIIEKI